MREKKIANLEIKKINRSNIYHLIRQKQNLSRQDIVVQLRLSLPTVTQNLMEMMTDGLIHESGSIGNTGGRCAKTYSTTRDARIAIGLDMTKSHVSAVAVDLIGTVICKKHLDLKFQATDSYYKKLGELVSDLIETGSLDTAKLLGVGIGVPGLIVGEEQRVFYGKVLNFTNATCAEIAKYIPYPAKLIHDASAAGFAEKWINSDIESFFYIMLNNSIGGALILNGNVYTGENLRSAEIGHLKIVPNGKKCYCGGRGCMDPYCSAGALTTISSGNVHTFFNLLNQDVPMARQIWNEYLQYLATAVNGIRMLIDCPVILGGYIGEYMDTHIEELRAIAAKMDPFQENAEYIDTCQYKNEAIAAGAALTFVDEFVTSI